MTNLNPGALSSESVVVRQLREDDLAAIVRIDRASIGRARPLYYETKVKRILTEGKLQTSLVAEVDGLPVGFVLTTLNYGEFGQTEPAAVIDSIGVMPAFRGRRVGDALVKQLETNMRASAWSASRPRSAGISASCSRSSRTAASIPRHASVCSSGSPDLAGAARSAPGLYT